VHQPTVGGDLRQGRRARHGRGSAPVQLYKNNTDNKGASYGSYENYLIRLQLVDLLLRRAGRRAHRPGLAGGMYSEIAWLGTSWTASTRANANRTTGLPNSYSRGRATGREFVPI
jgi:hypothetical protein